MRFLADECCDAQMVAWLRQVGHDVFYVVESMRGASDSDILAKAFDENRILLTEDKDFGELVYRLHRPAHGIIFLRFTPAEELQRESRLQILLDNHSTSLTGSFIVLEVDKLRIRPLRP